MRSRTRITGLPAQPGRIRPAPPLRDRLHVVSGAHRSRRPGPDEQVRVAAEVDTFALAYYSGLLGAPAADGAPGLEALMQDYFRLPVRVVQFQGRAG